MLVQVFVYNRFLKEAFEAIGSEFSVVNPYDVEKEMKKKLKHSLFRERTGYWRWYEIFLQTKKFVKVSLVRYDIIKEKNMEWKRRCERMDNMNLKKLPIGVDNFSEIRTKDLYYVDKTNLIKELVLNCGKVNLFTRPRRFGKSLNMSMLQCFFETGRDKDIFKGLDIVKEKELCEKYMGKYPVVSVSLKDVNGESFEAACNSNHPTQGSSPADNRDNKESKSDSKRLDKLLQNRKYEIVHAGNRSMDKTQDTRYHAETVENAENHYEKFEVVL